MEKVSTVAVENFLASWNGLFPDMPLVITDLKKPQAVMMALFEIFDRLGISRDAILMAPEDSDEHTTYYRDLLPIINSTRIFNDVVSILPEAGLHMPIIHLLQPTTMKSYVMLMVLVNLMTFNEARLEDTRPDEDKLFAHKDVVKKLRKKKDDLIQERNMEAVEKGNRAERDEQLDHDIPLFEEEVKQEKEIEAEGLQESEAVTEENKQTDILLEQKKAHRDGILAETARKKALKVYDAEDVRGQAEQAAQNVREAEEKLSALSLTLTQKETSVSNLQTLKPTLDQSNTLLHDLMKMADSIKDFENGDLDTDSVEGELDVLGTELAELEASLADARDAAARDAARRQEKAAARQQNRLAAEGALKEWEEKHRRSSEEAERDLHLMKNIKEATAKYEQEKAAGMAELANIQEQFVSNVTSIQVSLLNKVKDVNRRIGIQMQREK